MQGSFIGRNRVALIVLVFVLAGASAAVYWFVFRKTLPRQGDPRYESYVSAFQTGTAYLDLGIFPKKAEERFTEAIQLIPQEPTAWANRAIANLSPLLPPESLKAAAPDIEKARALAPNNPDIEELAGILAFKERKYEQAKELMQKASDSNPPSPRRIYRLSGIIAVMAPPDADQQRLRLLDKILELEPDHIRILAERALLYFQIKDYEPLKQTIQKFNSLSKTFNEESKKWLAKVNKDIADPTSSAFAEALRGFTNVVKAEPGYHRNSDDFGSVDHVTGMALHRFIRLEQPRSTPDPIDSQLAFKLAPLNLDAAVTAKNTWAGVMPVWLDGKSPPALFVWDNHIARRADGAAPVLTLPGNKDTALSPVGIIPIDWNCSFANGIVLAGAGGLRFYEQKPDGSFDDVTAKTKLPQEVLSGDWYGGWAIDIDFDGDLDIVLARQQGPPILLRNNFDGTFTPQPIFPEVDSLRAFAWVDFDNDGAADAAMLDASGKLHVYMNQRSGLFARRAPPDATAKYHALAVMDANYDGVFDLIAITDAGVMRISDRDKGAAWEVGELAKVQGNQPLQVGETRLFAVDLDNNGAIDIVLRTPTGGTAWLADGKGGFTALAASVPPGISEIVDRDNDGSLHMYGFGQDKSIEQHQTVGTKSYRSFSLKPRSLNAVGDARVNSFGLQSNIEIRSGVLVAKQPIDSPTVHFGLGSRQNVDVARITWTNGSWQDEFPTAGVATVTAQQRLKGSCPFLFAWNGSRMEFVSDFCWSTPLGMYINAQDKGGFLQTTDWTRIRGDQLVPRDGLLDVRINANLWETHYLDELALVAVDHPPDTEMYVDERFFLEPTTPQVYLTGPSKPVARALDHKGQDVTEIVRNIDAVYLDRAGRGRYQGITNDHWVEIDLGDDAPTSGPVYLLAHGWIHPTDSSINYALGQNSNVKPVPLSLEVPDGKGGWKVGRGGLGFPAGKNKTCVFRLDGIEGAGVSRRVRLRTNLEIYWDALHYASGLSAEQCQQRRLPIKSADLAFRGIIRMSSAGPSSPELPHYDDVIHHGQYWRDLAGWYTRHGDVKELIAKSDDRFVIMNAGDDLRLTYEAPAAPPQGWKRDYIWICDGWVKDGDLNTRWDKTVLPLPYHGMKSYDIPPGKLEDDPVYRRFPEDWVKYHTRYVTPDRFERGLRTGTNR